jgi:hypothetical protein
MDFRRRHGASSSSSSSSGIHLTHQSTPSKSDWSLSQHQKRTNIKILIHLFVIGTTAYICTIVIKLYTSISDSKVNGNESQLLKDGCNDLFSKDCQYPPLTGPEDVEVFFNDFRERGGIVFFLHNPKTGGTTVREFLKSQVAHPEEHYLETHKEKSWAAIVKKIDNYVQNGTNGTTIFVEDHVYPSIYRTLLPKLRKWRDVAANHSVPFFVFSMVREPLSRYISGFNYYKVQNRKQDPTEENFLKYLDQDPNVQCKFFLHMSCPPEMTGIRQTQLQTVVRAVDWITPTPNISNELLPLLAYMSKIPNHNVGIIQPKPFGPVPKQTLSISQLSSVTIAKVAVSSTIDQALFDLVVHRYDFGRMRAYLAQMEALTYV